MALPTKRQLINYLQSGRSNSLTAREIAEHFNISDGGVEVPIRNVIREAIQDGELIGSHSRGFYIIEEEADFRRYVRSLESRRTKIATRISNLLQNWNSN